MRVVSSSPIALLVLCTAVGGGVACAIDQHKLRDLVGPPPDFHNLDETYLQDGMWRLGHDVQDLNDTFSAAELDDAAREQRVIALLDDMAAAAAQANAPGTKKSHKNVAMNIDKMVSDIAAAKQAAEAHDLAPARALPQTCLACHQGAGGGPQK